jgi:hypothetical protein
MQETEIVPGPRDLVIHFSPIPPPLARDMRTLERPPGSGPHEADPKAIGGSAIRVMREIESALADHLGFDDGLSALGFSEETNSLTGAPALILRRLKRDGCYSAPLAEMVSPTGRAADGGVEQFDQVRALAYRFGLRLWIHRTESGSHVVYVPFAVCRPPDDATRMFYLVRLLVTPFEVEQWRSPLLEEGTGRPLGKS